jgi:methyl-accepting chemotaxis protein
MGILAFLESPGGLTVLHLLQTVLFSIMVYILAAEYWRTRDSSLVYKLLASCSITFISGGTAVISILSALYGITVSEKFLPLMFNALFALVVLFLARAFIYEHLVNRKRFDVIIRSGMALVAVFYILSQVYWLSVYRPGMLFIKSGAQILFSSFFIFMLSFSIYYLARFRKKYKLRLLTGFASIAVAQIIVVYIAATEQLHPLLTVIKAAAPLLVPLMFTSVVFKELIERVVSLVDSIRLTFEQQRELTNELIMIGSDLSSMSDTLVKSAMDGWSKLSLVVELIHKQIEDNDNLTGIASNAQSYLAGFDRNLLDSLLDRIRKGIPANSRIEVSVDARAILADELKISMEFVRQIKENAAGMQRMIPEINSFVENIDEISDRTSMLSLNASIEAARAGEHGRGFTIVADEVSRLAESSMEGARNFRKKISALAGCVESAMNGTGALTEKIQAAASSIPKLQKDTGRSAEQESLPGVLEEIRNLIDRYSKIVTGIFREAGFISIITGKNVKHSNEMKSKISEHIGNLESIAGISDQINELITNLNGKINTLIQNSTELEKLLK